MRKEALSFQTGVAVWGRVWWRGGGPSVIDIPPSVLLSTPIPSPAAFPSTPIPSPAAFPNTVPSFYEMHLPQQESHKGWEAWHLFGAGKKRLVSNVPQLRQIPCPTASSPCPYCRLTATTILALGRQFFPSQYHPGREESGLYYSKHPRSIQT